MTQRSVSGDVSSFAYPRRRWLASMVFADALLASVLVLLLFARPWGPFAGVLALAIVAALAWGVVTLHFPSSVEISPSHVAFSRYGREHRFAWRDVTRVRVRRFLVKDRVMVLLAPSPPWRGRYWILESIDGFDELVAAFEGRGRA